MKRDIGAGTARPWEGGIPRFRPRPRFVAKCGGRNVG